MAQMMGLRVAAMWSVSFLIVASTFPAVWCDLGYMIGILSFVTVGMNVRGIRRFVMPMSWLQGWVFTLLSFMGGVLITTLVQYVYFAFYDHGHFMAAMREVMLDERMIETLRTTGNEKLLEQMKESADMMQAMTPRQLAISFFTSNTMIALAFSLISSLFGGRPAKEEGIQNQG